MPAQGVDHGGQNHRHLMNLAARRRGRSKASGRFRGLIETEDPRRIIDGQKMGGDEEIRMGEDLEQYRDD
jgi:hypothetical protein